MQCGEAGCRYPEGTWSLERCPLCLCWEWGGAGCPCPVCDPALEGQVLSDVRPEGATTKAAERWWEGGGAAWGRAWQTAGRRLGLS